MPRADHSYLQSALTVDQALNQLAQLVGLRSAIGEESEPTDEVSPNLDCRERILAVTEAWPKTF